MPKIREEACIGCPGALVCTVYDTITDVVACPDCGRVFLRYDASDFVKLPPHCDITENPVGVVVNETCPRIPPNLGGPEGIDRRDYHIVCNECYDKRDEDLGTVSDVDEWDYSDDESEPW
jgi:hypothetical protein